MAFGRSSLPGLWRDRLTTALMLLFGALVIAGLFRLKQQMRLSHAHRMLDSEMPIDAAMEELGADWARINDDAPGQMVVLRDRLASGKTTIVFVASRNCPSSAQMSHALKRLACLRTDLAVRRLESDRPEAAAIDWQSPVALELKIHAFPWLAVFDPDGREVARGDPAKALVRAWYQGAGR